MLLPGRLWSTLGRLVVGHWLVLLLAVAGVTGLVVGGVLWRRSQPAGESSAAPVPPQRPLRPLPGWLLGIGFLAVVAITWAAVWGLQATVPAGVGTPLERAQLRVETIRTGLSVGAGAGAAAALLLALRRQQVTERTQQATEYDAGEKRVTELYVKAADQLGSDKAPVRLAGLYALERLAQDNPVHRQSIVEVICAYLRMPYTPPLAEEQKGQGSAEPDAVEATDTAETPNPDQPTPPDPREERQVRLAAQRILARHLRPTTPDGTPLPIYWSGVTVDLTEATLLNADYSNCELKSVKFDGATFSGSTRFIEARFIGDGRFNGVTFTDEAWFDNAIFSGDSWFVDARFTSAARFGRTRFDGAAHFSRSEFVGTAWFDEAQFIGTASFADATFGGDDAWFDGAVFSRTAWFGRATFTGTARFGNARFSDTARFAGATFKKPSILHGVTVGRSSRRGDYWPEGWQFDEKAWQVVRVPVEESLEGDAEPG
ncbi:pentapeptide repeat-containing protein [Micromonospora sp. LOL_014]|uniref:pentapeptide repeat-containing protein n=1 Tax=Micromonospora sp. LOL_014 TaxID=3345415 RepID=UPI003A87A966